jgi:hypothetical protein
MASSLSRKTLFYRRINGHVNIITENGNEKYFFERILNRKNIQDHLACFLAGNMGLGWYFHRDLVYLLDMAKDLTKTCYQMYAKQATGLSPEIAYFNIDSHSDGPTIIIKVYLFY